jgi:hypothetical protein
MDYACLAFSMAPYALRTSLIMSNAGYRAIEVSAATRLNPAAFS